MEVNRIVVGSSVAIMFCSKHIIPGGQGREVQLHGVQRLLLFVTATARVETRLRALCRSVLMVAEYGPASLNRGRIS
jgi:hypothetical protein